MTQHQKAERLAYHMMRGDRFGGIPEARRYMVEWWRERNAAIPNWVDPDTVQLDLAYTDPAIAKSCVADLLHTIPDGMTFVEPCAGMGAFVECLPHSISMDVLPRHDNIERGEFLTWEPPGGGPYCVVGAPPFGERLWLTNAFTVHALDIAEWVGYITDARALKDMPNGSLHHAMPLEPGAMRGLSGGRIRRDLEWRVWKAVEFGGGCGP